MFIDGCYRYINGSGLRFAAASVDEIAAILLEYGGAWNESVYDNGIRD